jgi:hypothetical protein
MSTPLTEIVEGWTGALPFTLNADGDPVDLTGLTVYVVLRDNRYNLVKDSTSGITLTSSTAGQVTYGPSSSDFVASKSPYRIRFRVKDALQKVVYFPNAEEDLITVRDA